MKILNYGFIVLAPGYHPDQHFHVMKSDIFETRVIGVSSIEQAKQAARTLAKDGVQVVELCGGFGEEAANDMIASLDLNIPMGYVMFNAEEAKRLSQVLAG